MSSICKTCEEKNCTKHSLLLGKIKNLKNFSGSTPPEIFIGRWNYPNVYTGILSPTIHGNTEIFSSPKIWHKKRIQISEIQKFRSQLIYGRTQSNIKKLETSFLSIFKEIAMTHKSISTFFSLKKQITKNLKQDSIIPLIPKSAQVKSVTLQENAPVKKKIDYLVNDIEVKSSIAIKELSKSKIEASQISKILSAGLLGMRKKRRLVPTRWSITAVDDTISKEKLKRIRFFPEISEFKLFHSEYLGNHYEILLLPAKYSFEVIEISINPTAKTKVWQDYESFFPRKKYAGSVVGGYYAVRLSLTEYLEKIKRQCSCLVLREIHPQYYAPCGVGILREIVRSAFSKKPETFQTLQEALQTSQIRIKQSIENYTNKSWILKNFGKQKKIFEFL